jgi:hypothetical protein
MHKSPQLDHTQLVPDDRVRPQDTVGDEGGATLVGTPKRADVDAPGELPPTTPPDGNRAIDDTEETR